MTTFLGQPIPIPIVHRGGGFEAPESSLEAVEIAVTLGFGCIEIDTRLTADGHIVVAHDDTLTRLGRPNTAISGMSWDALRQIAVGGGTRIAPLREYLTTWPRVNFLLDIKHDECVAPVADLVASIGAIDRVCITGSQLSASSTEETWLLASDRMRAARELLGPQVCTTVGHESVRALVTGNPLPPDEGGRCVLVGRTYDGEFLLTERFMAGARHHGLLVLATDHGDREFRQTLLDLGVDGIVTDEPSELRAMLRSRHQWTSHTPAMQGDAHA